MEPNDAQSASKSLEESRQKEPIRIDLICGILSDHMLNGLVSARMEFHPRVCLQHSAFEYHDISPLCNHARDLSS